MSNASAVRTHPPDAQWCSAVQRLLSRIMVCAPMCRSREQVSLLKTCEISQNKILVRFLSSSSSLPSSPPPPPSPLPTPSPQRRKKSVASTFSHMSFVPQGNLWYDQGCLQYKVSWTQQEAERELELLTSPFRIHLYIYYPVLR